ncbi:hypothetical protein QUB70_04240 [Microcoleus sp. A003_D6]|uniref:hypothetical protein n=1 Tax=Microcoleus sp. A003_D6 TaxID=3055266 RepID=UPI002FD2680B
MPLSVCFTQLAIEQVVLQILAFRSESRLQHHSARHSGRPAPAGESADVSGFLAHRKPEMHFWE